MNLERKILYLFLFSTLLIFGCSRDEVVNSNGGGSGSGNRPPTTPKNPTPADSAVNISPRLALFWQCSDPDGSSDTVKYIVRLKEASGPGTDAWYIVPTSTPAQNGIDVGVVRSNKRFNWYVTAYDTHGDSTKGPIWTFTTGD